MRRHTGAVSRSAPTRSVGEMKMDQADLARDAKKEEAMCASSLCTASHNLTQAPKGYSGRYGGHHLCPKHYKKVVDRLLESLNEHGCAPWERTSDGGSASSGNDDGTESLKDLFR